MGLKLIGCHAKRHKGDNNKVTRLSEESKIREDRLANPQILPALLSISIPAEESFSRHQVQSKFTNDCFPCLLTRFNRVIAHTDSEGCSSAISGACEKSLGDTEPGKYNMKILIARV